MLTPLSKEQKKRIQQVFKDLSKKEGTQDKLAISLQVTKSSISQLISGLFLPSARICLLIESKYGIKKEILRPDIFMIN